MRILDVGSTRVSRIPAGLTSLQELRVTNCTELSDAWPLLAADSRHHVRVLRAAESNLRFVPEGMGSLEEIFVAGCAHLHKGWLPACSRARLRVLDINYKF